MQTPPLEIDVIDDADEFGRLRLEWNTLLEQSRQDTIFLSWEWLFTWWETFGKADFRLQILKLKSNDQTVAIAPFLLRTRGFRRRRVMQFIGVGEPDQHQVVSEYLDVFSDPEWEGTVVSTLSQWFNEQSHWDRFECADIKEGFLIWRIVKQLQQSIPTEVRANRTAFSVPLDINSNYLERLSNSRRKRLARSLRALEADGGLSRRPITHEGEIATSFATLAQLHSERWGTKKIRGVFESEVFSNFHLRILELLWPLGKAGIETYSVDGKPLAIVYCFYTRKIAYYYQSGFASADANRYMALSHAHNREIERNTLLGRQYYDLMRGGADSYKNDFGCETFALYRLFLFKTALERRVFLARMSVGAMVSRALAWCGVRRH